MLIRATPTTRRTAMAAGLSLGVAGVTAGCTSGGAGDGPSATPGGRAAASSEPPVDADTDLVEGVVERVGRVAALVEGALAGYPALRERQGALRRLHRAHLEELDAARDAPGDVGGPAGGVDVAVPTTPTDALRLVRRQETGLQRFLTDAAVAAESGALAALLASMSAAVAQQLAVLG